jgi:hypothetical protein
MKRMVEEPGLRARASREGRESFFERWHEPVVIAQYLEVVRKVAIRRGQRDVVARLAPGLPPSGPAAVPPGTLSALRGQKA